ncbi:hypothetical protein G6F42_018555 [Rhizopus arrhizus]|nr:hypothetical protein G6F42_018555 [Rhizopus arrhizus]
MSKNSSLSPEVGAWIAEAASLEPPYDYFDFANQFELNQNTTNILYSASLNSHLQTCSHQKLKPCLNALARYKLINVFQYNPDRRFLHSKKDWQDPTLRHWKQAAPKKIFQGIQSAELQLQPFFLPLCLPSDSSGSPIDAPPPVLFSPFVQQLEVFQENYTGLKFLPRLLEKSVGWCGIQFNATENKQTVDESKMMKSMITMIEYTEHMLNIEPPIPPQYFVRSFVNNLYFEALYKLKDGSFYKRCYVNIPFPTTPKELLEYVDGTPDMLAWKQAIVQFARGASKINT